MRGRSSEGPALDGSVQYLGDAPHWQGDGETVDVVDDAPTGAERTSNVSDLRSDRPDVDGQSMWEDWGR